MNQSPDNSRATENEDADPVGPSDGQVHYKGAKVEVGGGPDTAPLNFDDDEIYSNRDRGVRNGGTTHAQGGDSAPLGPPAEIHSDTNAPSAGLKS